MPQSPDRVSVDLVEVGPRDGLQNEQRSLPVATRIALIERLAAAGSRRIEAVSFVRGDWVPQMADAEAVLTGLPALPGVSLIGLVLNRRGAERAAATRCDEINIVLPVTETFSQRNQGADIATLLDQAAAAVPVARAAGQRVSVTLTVAFGCPFEGPVAVDQVDPVVQRVLDLGIDELAFADTIGVGVPDQVERLAGLVLGDDRLAALRFHFHNTRNTGYANASAVTRLDLSALGQRVALDASVGGFGGCPFAPNATGNIATEDLLYLLRGQDVELLSTDASPTALAALTQTATWLSAELDSPVTALLGRAGDYGAAR